MIRCTAKLLKEIRPFHIDPPGKPAEVSLLGDWYANIFFLNRRKCILFTNERTLFSAVAFDTSKSEIRDLGALFRMSLGKVLLEEDLDGALIQRIVNGYRDVQFGRAISKSVLGTMNGAVMDLKGMVVWRDGGIDRSDFPIVMKKLNRIPLKPINYHYAIEELHRVLVVSPSVGVFDK